MLSPLARTLQGWTATILLGSKLPRAKGTPGKLRYTACNNLLYAMSSTSNSHALQVCTRDDGCELVQHDQLQLKQLTFEVAEASMALFC